MGLCGIEGKLINEICNVDCRIFVLRQLFFCKLNATSVILFIFILFYPTDICVMFILYYAEL